mgnify:CR=1 FL=1
MPDSFDCSASVKAFVLALFSYAVLISASVWSAVALFSIPASLVSAASLKLLVSLLLSYKALISEAL